ncbi:MAG: hypothetical protein IPP99_18630 [Chitinophagaceae bacterium]|nr:hypothetical protein [Chitinophagaceae bacterium]
MIKYQVTIQFEMTEEFMSLVPPHRTYIGMLINKGIIDHYAVSIETQRAWITLNADSKKEVEKFSPNPLCTGSGIMKLMSWWYSTDSITVFPKSIRINLFLHHPFRLQPGNLFIDRTIGMMRSR